MELPVSARTALSVLGAADVALKIGAQIDLGRRSADEIVGSKLTWRLVSLINLIGPLAYFGWGRRTVDRPYA